jgi:uncharacterized protein YndB with AHSA1/START domain
MLVRQVVIPVDVDQLWEALTEPDAVSAWFGSQVEWDLRPGGPAHFLDDDGTVRHGVVVAVERGRHLSFRWWPQDHGAEATSVVNLDLEPEEDGGGTRLTVTEEAEPPATGAPVAQASAGPSVGASWTGWDSRLLWCWSRSVVPAAAGRAVR